MADWMTMLANENTALCTPAGRPMLKMRFKLAQRFPLHAHAFIRARQADVEQCRAHGVGRHRGDGDAVDRHMQHNDEKEV